jgi:glycosyltransferase involved in cell wall biosynthesis
MSGGAPTYSLSYLLNTRNKLRWLEESVPRLLKAKTEGCEVVVVDGGSTDGSPQYLLPLHQAGLIDQYVSEPDYGEAHGWNKGLLLCRGSLIKLITDDDVFDYTAIQRCREYMESNEEIDLLVTPAVNATAAGSRVVHHHLVCQLENEQAFRRRREMNTCGLGVLLRRRALPLLGLFNTHFVWIDYEFLSRAIHCRVVIAWFSDPVAFRIHNADSISERFAARMSTERRRLGIYYGEGKTPSLIDRARGLKQQGQRTAAAIRDYMRRRSHQVHEDERAATDRDGPRVGPQICVRDVFELGEDILRAYRSADGSGAFAVSHPASVP